MARRQQVPARACSPVDPPRQQRFLCARLAVQPGVAADAPQPGLRVAAARRIVPLPRVTRCAAELHLLCGFALTV